MLKLLVLAETCARIHNELEKAMSNLFSKNSENDNYDACFNSCPMCLNRISNHILLVRNNGLQNFLATSFLSSQGAFINAIKIQHSLKTHTNVEKDPS